MLKTFQLALAILLLLILGATGCARPWTPPPDRFVPPPPKIMVRTPEGLVPEIEATTQSAEQQKRKGHSADSSQFSSQADVFPGSVTRWSLAEGQPEAVRLESTRPTGLGSPTIDASKTGPIYPQYYYVRPEHTSTGYIEGKYGRINDYTPGEHTSTGYSPGHYRGDGNYTRPEHTSTGYIPGHYRAEPQPDARSMIGVNTTSSTPAFSAYGR